MQICPLPWTLRRVVVLLPALCCISCSHGSVPLNPVQGRVLYKNQPIADAIITFHPQGLSPEDLKATFPMGRPMGTTDENGMYSLRTGDRDGAPAGSYVVTVVAPEMVSTGKMASTSSKPESVDRLKGAYAREVGSQLRFEVNKGNNELEPIKLN